MDSGKQGAKRGDASTIFTWKSRNHTFEHFHCETVGSPCAHAKKKRSLLMNNANNDNSGKQHRKHGDASSIFGRKFRNRTFEKIDLKKC